MSTADPLALLLTQLEVERIGVVDGDTLVRLPGERPDGIPRFYVADLVGTGALRFYRSDVPPDVRSALAALTPEQARSDFEAVHRILAMHRPSDATWVGASYYFPDAAVGSSEYPDVIALDRSQAAFVECFDPELVSFGWPVYAVVCDGKVVSTCVSTRETERAGEAWVQTAPEYRGRGFARQVTAAWGHALVLRGKVAFYSHASDNPASEGVARSLGLTRYLHDVGYS